MSSKVQKQNCIHGHLVYDKDGYIEQWGKITFPIEDTGTISCPYGKKQKKILLIFY